MRKLLISSVVTAAILSMPARAQEIEYTIKLNGTDLNTVASGIQELPAKVANPLMQKLQTQVQAQNDERSKAAAAKLPVPAAPK